MIDKDLSKICLVTYPSTRHGGIQAVARMVIQALSEDPSVRLRIVSVGDEKFYKLWHYLNLFFCVLWGYRPMFMHAYLYQACPARYWLLRSAGAIVWCHGIEVWGHYSRNRVPALGKGAMLWAVSRFTAAQIQENWPNAQVQVVPLAVADHIASVNPGFRADNPKELRFLTVSRFDAAERYKGHDLSLQALSRLRRDNVRFRLDMVGEGDDRVRLMHLVTQLDLESHVFFHGAIEDASLQNLYANADLFLMPSQLVMSENGIWGGEGFGLVYLEAAMYGVPSIAGEFGGHSDFIEHNVTGWRVADDVNALVDLLRHLSRNFHEIRKCGLSCYRKASSQYSLSSFKRNLHRALQPERDLDYGNVLRDHP